MDANRRIAIVVGVLYIIGTLAGVLSVVFTSPSLSAPDYLGRIPANENQIILGGLCVLVMGFALALVPVLLYPIFKKQNEILALGYVVFRGGLETVTDMLVAVAFLLLPIAGRGFAQAGAAQASGYAAMGDVLQGVTHLPVTGFAFSLGALMIYTLLYRSKLVPRWISVWGFIAIALQLATLVLITFGLQNDSSIENSLMNAPIFFQEMVMAVWLIARGFNPTALKTLAANPA